MNVKTQNNIAEAKAVTPVRENQINKRRWDLLQVKDPKK